MRTQIQKCDSGTATVVSGNSKLGVKVHSLLVNLSNWMYRVVCYWRNPTWSESTGQEDIFLAVSFALTPLPVLLVLGCFSCWLGWTWFLFCPPLPGLGQLHSRGCSYSCWGVGHISSFAGWPASVLGTGCLFSGTSAICSFPHRWFLPRLLCVMDWRKTMP